MNRVLLYGRVSQKSELRKTSNDNPVVNFNIATGYGEKVTFVPVVAWGSAAEIVDKYVNKGDRLSVEGHITMSKNIRNDIEINEYKVTANVVELVETKKEKEQNDPNTNNNPEPKVTNDDLPF